MGETWWSDRVVLERAWLSLPAAIGDKTGAFAKEVAELRLGRLLTWQAERLLEDLDVARAGSFLEHVPEVYRHTRSHREARERLDALGKPGLAVLKRQPAGELVLTERPLALSLDFTARAEFPKGEAAFVLGNPDDSKVHASVDAQGARDWVSELAAVGGRDGPTRLRATIHRTNDKAKDARTSLVPAVFYRGVTFPTDPELVAFRLDAVKKEVDISFRTHDFAKRRKLAKGRVIEDQHLKHPRDCFLHTGGVHPIDLVLTYIPRDAKHKTMHVEVVATMDDKPLWSSDKNVDFELALEAARPKVVQLAEVRAVDVKPGEMGSVIQVTVLLAAPYPLFPAILESETLRVHKVETSQFYEAEAKVVDKEHVRIRITRLPNDPISAEELCQASVGGGTLVAVVHSDPRFNDKMGPDDGLPARVPLLQREYAEFYFRIGAAIPSDLEYTALAGGASVKVKGPPKPTPAPGAVGPGGPGVPGVPSAGPAPPAGG